MKVKRYLEYFYVCMELFSVVVLKFSGLKSVILVKEDLIIKKERRLVVLNVVELKWVEVIVDFSG